ncbi:MAG: N-acetylmuramic acid 6-phosphate etherase [Phycisphaerae bacterium]|nr:N-acetylmuramic acid 6-phosphate etherase [Phycisphaerae bacterium]
MRDRGHIATEQRNPAAADLDRMTIGQAVALMQAEDAKVAVAVAAERADIVRAVELVVAAFKGGGRLIYLGAGTSGRLGVLDASECPPTFRTPPEMVVGVICGGDGALRRSVEGAEDKAEVGVAAIADAKVGEKDVVVGIAAGGTTTFVAAALAEARRRNAKTIFLTCVPPEHATLDVDLTIRPLVGPEIVTGSTRLKAGTATKMVLNQISTVAMVQLGKTYGDLMVDLNAVNMKLVDRGTRIISSLTNLDRPAAHDLLRRANNQVKVALVMHARKVDAAGAEKLLADHDGRVRAVIGR